MNLASKFDELIRQWERDTLFHSNLHFYQEHPAFKEIVALGEPVLPLIFQKLEKGSSFISLAIPEITGERLDVVEELVGKTAAQRDLWLEWGRNRGYLQEAVMATTTLNEALTWMEPLTTLGGQIEVCDSKSQVIKIVKFYTLTNCYTVILSENAQTLTVDAVSRKPRAGLQWAPGKHIFSGALTSAAWNQAVARILRYEMVKLHCGKSKILHFEQPVTVDKTSNKRQPGESYNDFKERIREARPKAWTEWLEEDEELLVAEFQKGTDVKRLSELLQRRVGGVVSKLEHMGLMQPGEYKVSYK